MSLANLISLPIKFFSRVETVILKYINYAKKIRLVFGCYSGFVEREKMPTLVVHPDLISASFTRISTDGSGNPDATSAFKKFPL